MLFLHIFQVDGECAVVVDGSRGIVLVFVFNACFWCLKVYAGV